MMQADGGTEAAQPRLIHYEGQGENDLIALYKSAFCANLNYSILAIGGAHQVDDYCD